MTSLLQEIISVYTLLNPSQLTAAASNRVCNALALLQCVASHNDTRALFLNGKDPVQCSNSFSLIALVSSYPAIPLPIPQYNFEVEAIRVSKVDFIGCHWW